MSTALSLVGDSSISDFGREFVRCLRLQPHCIAPKHFYDGVGSRLFERICELPEYYLTRTELAILRRHAPEMATLIGPGAEVIEFGAGSLVKIRLLLDALQPYRFTAIDISGEHLYAALAALRADYPDLRLLPLVADFTALDGLALGKSVGRKVGFFPGSTIGNLTPAQAQRFLSSAARLLRGGGLLIGVDLVKDPAILHAAYNDAAGVTAEFNLNLLARANRELDATIDCAGFRHYAHYNAPQQRVEMHLVATRPQRFAVLGRQFDWRAGESIHTENSHKYTVQGFAALAAGCGFRPRARWLDNDSLFCVFWLTC